ncbi:MAG: FAD-dependent oxidoreductase [Thermodesulfobacteriota bacterium]|nr:FAD-dependent oxidoreductase [Thermodesulfobacteriota bacterium]
MAEKKQTGTVLVAGAGISGIRAAIELAETGYRVILIDSSPQIGGILAKLDNQFPTDHCGICRMLPMIGRESASQYCMRKGLYHENIEILPFTEIQSIEGDAGNYTIELKRKPRYIDTDRCSGLLKCIDVCPVETKDEFNHGLTKRKAVYQPVPHSTPPMLLVDMDICTRCDECVKVCPTDAIDLDAVETKDTRNVHAVIFASGVTLYNLTEFEDAKSYSVSEDVVTALAFERILSGTGTYDGKIRRPSDQKPAEKIAWIQCMGSRNRRQNRDYCSSICCMFALKEAVFAREKGGENLEATIFYMDMRTFGKDYYRYQERAVEEYNVRLVRCRVNEVVLNSDKTLAIRYYDPEQNRSVTDNYDMVVMSTGQIPFEDHRKLADLLGIELNTTKLLPTEPYDKVKLTKSGVFICGSLMGLTDISEAVSSGTAAAGQAAALLSSLDVSVLEEEDIPEPEGIDNSVPAISIVLCQCTEKPGSGAVDFNTLENQISSVNGVSEINVLDTICSDAGQKELVDILEKSTCNRLLIGACQPYIYRNTLKNLARKAGFSASLIDIFDLSSMVHAPEAVSRDIDLTRTAFKEIRSNIENLKFKPPLYVEVLPVTPAALVVGGGIAGMRAALSLASRKIEVHLVEKTGNLGGLAGSQVYHTIDNLEPVSMAKALKASVIDHKHITVHLNSRLVASTGTFGDFETTIKKDDKENLIHLHHGAAIIATGGHEGRTDQYEYGNSERILTQGELKKGLRTGDIDVSNAETIVMIQCAGSREKNGRRYCSRICCIGAIENALTIKKKNPEARIFILYRDMMTYGFAEQYYSQARSAGVIFVSFSLDAKPGVSVSENQPVVSFTDPVLQDSLEISPDFLVLSTGVDPEPSNREIGKIFDIPVNADGFFVEADPKWRPVEFNKTGFYLAGVAHSPMTLKDAILQAEAAAQKVSASLSTRTRHRPRVTSIVHHTLCVRCQRCIDVCPFDARSYDQALDRIVVNGAACQACGMCAVACRNNAAEVPGWNDRQIMAVMDHKTDWDTMPATRE